jgi:hypothetical protein
MDSSLFLQWFPLNKRLQLVLNTKLVIHHNTVIWCSMRAGRLKHRPYNQLDGDEAVNVSELVN